MSTSGMFLSSLILLTVSPTAFDAIGWRYYLVFMSLTIVAAVVFAVFFPEVQGPRSFNILLSSLTHSQTKGKTLEQIGAIFGDDNTVVLDGEKSEANSSAGGVVKA